MFFCPFCGTLLLLEPCFQGNHLACSTCRYMHPTGSSAVPVLTLQHFFTSDNKKNVDDEEEREAQAIPENGAEGAGGISDATEATAAAVAASMSNSAEGGQITTVSCENSDNPCDSTKAYYIQIQMRSADEPATVFFKCVKCGHQWRQD